MNYYDNDDKEAQALLDAMKEHYVMNCMKCRRDGKGCGNPLSISGFKNCLEFGLFLRPERV